MKRKVWILLSGCGLHDGTEVHEAAFAELSLARAGAKVAFCAPDVALAQVIDHQRGDVSRAETRSAVIESARIARGPVEPLSSLALSSVEALVIPGGFGAVKTLCDYAMRGRAATVQREVAALIAAVVARRAPIASMCMGNVLVARALGAQRVRVALGWDAAVDADCASWGAVAARCEAKSIVVDRESRVASTPAFSATSDLVIVADAIDRAVRASLELG
ncbi:MAG: isoprenoid biosynthesis glyoxalase ElbB [Myxococcales bacterium]|nr:isoprenoid biosynthesis glyoxalase ElbB [Myxococcales bacterium]